MSNAHDVEAMAKADTAPYVTFSLADEIYAIDVLQVQEVLKVTEIALVPGVPHYILGIINLRGNVVTVIDARRRMGLEERESDEASRIVIIDVDHQNVGILVDSVSEVVRISPSPSSRPRRSETMTAIGSSRALRVPRTDSRSWWI